MDPLPFVIDENTTDGNLPKWLAENRALVKSLLVTHGGLLFPGRYVDNVTSFEAVVDSFSIRRTEYLYRSTPRLQLGDRIYSATEYPKNREIPLHNENAYQHDWPLHLIFSCLKVAAAGGETPLASTARITERINGRIKDQFSRKKIMYVRNYGTGVDLPWETVFQTSEHASVETYCKAHRITFEWKADNCLRTQQVCDAFAIHPQTRQPLWFNQVHLFHISSLDDATRCTMLEVFSEHNLPRNAYYGDGSPIETSILDGIRDAYQQEKVPVRWREGNVLLLDNMLVCHGRAPFLGERKVLVAMTDVVSEQAVG